MSSLLGSILSFILSFVLCFRWKDGTTIHQPSSRQEISDKRSQLSCPDWKNKYVILCRFWHVINFATKWFHVNENNSQNNVYYCTNFRGILTMTLWACLSKWTDYSSDTSSATIIKRGVEHVWSDYHSKDSFLPSSAYCCSLPLAWGISAFCNIMHLTQSSPTEILRNASLCWQQSSTAGQYCLADVILCALSSCHDDPSTI